MKTFKIILLTALLCLSFCACQGGNSKSSSSQSSEEATWITTTEPQTDPPEGSMVMNGRKQEFTFTDKSGSKETVTYVIPSLNFKTSDAARINAEISAMYGECFTTAEQQVKNNQPLSCESLTYESYLNDDILTLMIVKEESHTITYSVYNYNKATGRQLTNDGLLEYLQLDREKTFAGLKSALEDDYYSKFKYENFPDDYYYQLEMSTGDNALEKSSLFLNQNAELYAICTEYASVGKGEFQVMIAIP